MNPPAQDPTEQRHEVTILSIQTTLQRELRASFSIKPNKTLVPAIQHRHTFTGPGWRLRAIKENSFDPTGFFAYLRVPLQSHGETKLTVAAFHKTVGRVLQQAGHRHHLTPQFGFVPRRIEDDAPLPWWPATPLHEVETSLATPAQVRAAADA